MARLQALVAAFAAVAALTAGVSDAVRAPPTGIVGIIPINNLDLGFRHCDYVCSCTPQESSNDFNFKIVKALNGVSPPERRAESRHFGCVWLHLHSTLYLLWIRAQRCNVTCLTAPVQSKIITAPYFLVGERRSGCYPAKMVLPFPLHSPLRRAPLPALKGGVVGLGVMM